MDRYGRDGTSTCRRCEGSGSFKPRVDTNPLLHGQFDVNLVQQYKTGTENSEYTFVLVPPMSVKYCVSTPIDAVLALMQLDLLKHVVQHSKTDIR